MMNIYMAGIDFNKAALDYREKFALTKTAQAELLRRIRALPGVSGCVVLSTCNRMELWLSFDGMPEKRPFDILCAMLNVCPREYEQYFTQRDQEEAVAHLFELACGLKSLIFGEEQILAQVKEAIAFARECAASDAILEAAFRRAVTAAKKAKTKVRLISVDRSAATTVIRMLREKYGSLGGLDCLVIGSGEMGRLTAKELVAEGCTVRMTLRRYHSGEAIVPAGCKVIDYEDRHGQLKDALVIISATRSPHYTLMYDDVKDVLGADEKMLFDLAVPRDIDPKIAELPTVSLYDIDHLGGNLAADEDNKSVCAVREIIGEEIKEFERWNCVRELMPKINEIGALASSDLEERIQNSLKHADLDDSCLELVHEAAGKAVSKVVENILLSLQKNTDTELMDSCLSDLDTLKPEEKPALPPRFPLFVDLTGKSIAVIGAGAIALRRIRTLLNYPCSIIVTAPEADQEIELLQRQGRLTLRKKTYEASDIQDAFLVVAATDKRELNHRIARDADRNGQYCSVADCKEECTFFFPATVQYDGGVIGVCGTGDNHARTKDMAAGIREYLRAREQL